MIFEKIINIYEKNAILKRFQANETEVSVIQGKVSLIVSETEILELQAGKTTMFQKIGEVEQTSEGLKTTYSNLKTEVDNLQNAQENLESHVTTFEQTYNGFKTEVESSINTNKDNIYMLSTKIEQTDTKISFLVKSEGSETGLTLTDEAMELITERFIVKSPDGTETIISNGKMTIGSITADNEIIADAAITNAKIANAAIGSTKIADAAIISAKIADAAITNAKIANAAIDSAKIKEINAEKITSGTMSADRIDVNGIFSKNIIATGTINGLNFKGGTIDIGDGNFVVNAKGELNAQKGTYKGSVQADSFSLVGASLTIINKVVSETGYSLNNGKVQGAQASVSRKMFVIDTTTGMYVDNEIYSKDIFTDALYSKKVSGSTGAFNALGANTLYADGVLVNSIVADSGWIDAKLGTWFSNYNDNQKVIYRKVGKVVTIQGAVKTKNTIIDGASSTIFTIPEGYRPKALVNQICQGSNTCSWLLTVASDGEVRLSKYSKGGSYTELTSSAWLPFQVMYMAS